jgi:hypothetical protein
MIQVKHTKTVEFERSTRAFDHQNVAQFQFQTNVLLGQHDPMQTKVIVLQLKCIGCVKVNVR